VNKKRIHQQQKKREKARKKRQAAKSAYQKRRERKVTHEVRLGKAMAMAGKADIPVKRNAIKSVVQSKRDYREFITILRHTTDGNRDTVTATIERWLAA
jgi:hypothetical protein